MAFLDPNKQTAHSASISRPGALGLPLLFFALTLGYKIWGGITGNAQKMTGRGWPSKKAPRVRLGGQETLERVQLPTPRVSSAECKALGMNRAFLPTPAGSGMRKKESKIPPKAHVDSMAPMKPWSW